MSEDKFLLVKGIAGLGNRIECVLTGILYARLTGRRLLVDWRDHFYSHGGANAFHHFFRCSACAPTDDIPTTDSVSPGIWRGHLNDTALCMWLTYYGESDVSVVWQKFSIELTKLDYQETVVVMWTWDAQVDALRPHFRDAFKEFSEASEEAILSQLLREDLILHPQIRDRVDRFKGDSFGQETVGVHVRYTDRRSRLWATLRALNRLLRWKPGLQIFLSTDNVRIRTLFEEAYPGVVSTPHWYSTVAGRPIHTDRDRPDPMESGAEALVDLYLLSECHYLVVDGISSFARVAKLLAKAPNSNVFDVGGKEEPRPRLTRGVMRRLGWVMRRLGWDSWGLRLLGRFVRTQMRIQRFFARRRRPRDASQGARGRRPKM